MFYIPTASAFFVDYQFYALLEYTRLNAATEQLNKKFQLNDTTDHLLHPERMETQNQKYGFFLTLLLSF